MADLLDDRLIPDEPPFPYVGIDFFGPLYVKQGRSTVKHYGCLFSCLTVRATHIEVTETLETDSFINALHRFVHRRGIPKMISDNETNLSGGEREIRKAINDWKQQKNEVFLHQKNIEWKFNPPWSLAHGRSLGTSHSFSEEDSESSTQRTIGFWRSTANIDGRS